MSDIEKIKHCGECPYYNKVGEYCTELGCMSLGIQSVCAPAA